MRCVLQNDHGTPIYTLKVIKILTSKCIIVVILNVSVYTIDQLFVETILKW